MGGRVFIARYVITEGNEFVVNNVYLCVGNYSNSPFYLEISDIYVYSMEELCYYLIDKIYLLDFDLMNHRLTEWIRKECGLRELADELELCIRRRLSLAMFVTTILEKTQIYEEQIIRKVDRILKEQAALTPFERKKKRAEHYFATGRFAQAGRLYRELLTQCGEEERSKAVLYHNLASVYAMDFAYEQAAKYYLEAYRISGDKQIRQIYIQAMRMWLSDYEYGVFMRDNPDWEEDFATVAKLWETTEADWSSSREMDMLAKWKNKGSETVIMKALKDDYRRQTV